jgi:ribosomal protein S15P/S13E
MTEALVLLLEWTHLRSHFRLFSDCISVKSSTKFCVEKAEHVEKEFPRGHRNYYSSHGLEITEAGRRALSEYYDEITAASKQQSKADSQEASKMASQSQSGPQPQKVPEKLSWLFSYLSKLPPHVQDAVVVSTSMPIAL